MPHRLSRDRSPIRRGNSHRLRQAPVRDPAIRNPAAIRHLRRRAAIRIPPIRDLRTSARDRSMRGPVRSMRLARHGGRGGDIGALPRAADGEHGALPLLAAARELLELGGLGADAAGQVDVGEHAVLARDGHVDLLLLLGRLGGRGLGLLLLEQHLLLAGADVAPVDVGGVLGVRPRVLEGTVGFLLDEVEGLVELVELVFELLLGCLLDDGADHAEQEGLEEVEEELVVGFHEFDV